MFHAKLPPSLSVSSISPQNYYVFNSPLRPSLFHPLSTFISCPLFLSLSFPFFFFFFNRPLSPPLILCTKWNDASSPEGSEGLGSLSTSGRQRHREGISVVQNTKQYPIVHPPFCFLQWEASSTKDIQWSRGPGRPFDRAGTKNDWCNPHNNTTVSIFNAETNKLIQLLCVCLPIFYFFLDVWESATLRVNIHSDKTTSTRAATKDYFLG